MVTKNDDAVFDAVKLLEIEFSLLDTEGKICILKNDNVKLVTQGEGDPTKNNLNFYVPPHSNIWMYRLLEASGLPLTEQDMKEATKCFMRGTGTTLYQGLAFHPNPKNQKALNLWRGHAVEPIEGDCKIFLDFIFEVLASSSEEKAQYLLKYLAHAIQFPHEKPEIMLVLISGQGTGKGSLFTLIRAIWPYTTLLAQDIAEVLGRFTGSLERSMWVLMDEALFTHDKKSSDKLKSFLTEPILRIEEKFQPARTIDSLHRCIAATNHSHFANIDRDDRRLFICEVSDIHKQDQEYFKTFHRAIADGRSVPAFVHYLMNLDISDFNVRVRPLTAEHAEQKLESLSGINLWWYTLLHVGTLAAGESLFGVQPRVWKESMSCTSKELRAAYLDFDKNAQRYKPVTDKKFISQIKILCPSSVSERWTDNDGHQCRGLSLPTLEIAREEFEKYMDCKINWEE